jgi:hypothetical protein
VVRIIAFSFVRNRRHNTVAQIFAWDFSGAGCRLIERGRGFALGRPVG